MKSEVEAISQQYLMENGTTYVRLEYFNSLLCKLSYSTITSVDHSKSMMKYMNGETYQTSHNNAVFDEIVRAILQYIQGKIKQIMQGGALYFAMVRSEWCGEEVYIDGGTIHHFYLYKKLKL